jgi:quinol monooxygenase YgiN
MIASGADLGPRERVAMNRFALWVEFEIKPGAMPAFLAAARKDAAGSITREPGCRRFDVLVDPLRGDRVCFYEVYDDEAAFEAHRLMPHFKAYLSATEALVASKTVTRLVAGEGGVSEDSLDVVSANSREQRE